MKRSKHNLSHYRLWTGDMGFLYPIGCIETLPGDTFQHNISLMLRLSPMATPVMHPIDVRVHSFFVPNRILWEEWEDFITGGPTGEDINEIPTVAYNTANAKNILDYLGVPPVDGLEINALPLRAVNRVWNEYFRDQDLQTEADEEDQAIKHIAWEKDYFTSARPWETKGPDITLPIGTTAPVEISVLPGIYPTFNGDEANLPLRKSTGGPDPLVLHGSGFGGENLTWFDPGLTGTADLSQANPVKINEVRRAFALQRYQEARARYGSRYTEYLRYLGVNNPSDARLQRPEYLGGGRQSVNISEVLQTGPDSDPGPGEEFGVGDMYGHGIAAMRSNRYRRFFEEHGYVVSFASVRPKTMYVKGAARHWLKRDKEDYYQKELAYIGQQPVYAGEVYADTDGANNDTFGYQDRYIEYKREQSYVSGDFRNTLNYWHLGREFEERPALNASFVECDPSKRIFNEQTTDVMWAMARHNLVARRIVPKSNASRII